jgi:hypothetical protein
LVPVTRGQIAVLVVALVVAAGASYGIDVALTANTTNISAYDQAIAYTKTRAPFSPARTIDVSSAAQLRSAIKNLRPGDLVRATTDVTVSSSSAEALVIENRLSAPAVIDLTGHTVRLVYSGAEDYSAVLLDNPKNVRIYGGDLSTSDTGGDCLRSYGAQHVTWWNFTAHDCGGTGAALLGGQAPTEHDDFNGTIWKVGRHRAWDPHLEKGTGLHCVNLDDNNIYPFRDNRFAFYCHDISSGAAIEYGAAHRATPKPVRNTIYLLAVNLTEVAKSQTGGNGIQFWGVDGQAAAIRFIQVDNAQGYALWDGGMNAKTSLTGVTIVHGRASNTNQNPRYTGQNPWSDRLGEVYRAVVPAPEGGRP